jgi:zinc and cadmium transporter
MAAPHWLVVYLVFVAGASLAGGKLPSIVRLTHARMQTLVSLVAGLMLGVGLFHLLPHAALELHSIDKVVAWMMAGLLATFFLIRAFQFHQHGPAEVADEPHFDNHGKDPSSEFDHRAAHAHSADCGHDSRHTTDEGKFAHRLSWVGMALGLSIHTLLDGIALAASVQADAHIGGDSHPAGLGTFLAIVLHKPLDSLSISALMAAGGWSANARRLVNALYAVLCPLGALVFWLGVAQMGGLRTTFLGWALAFSAGVFLCISLGDLLPELQFHSHDRLKLSAALLAGVGLAWAIRWLEPAHVHPERGGTGLLPIRAVAGVVTIEPVIHAPPSRAPVTDVAPSESPAGPIVRGMPVSG